MEAGTMCRNVHFPVVESTFDRIDSPQYLNFSDYIPEAKDSYFDRKVGDHPAEQRNSKVLQKLPIDYGDNLIQDQASENQNNPNTENNNGSNSKLSDDFGNDLIQTVQTLQVNQPGETNNNPKKIATSTPFRVKGVEPMPWRQNAKPETRHCTKITAFSFEERNKQLLQRKARRMEMILQAEKDARKFHANPAPKFLRKVTSINNPPSPSGSLNVEKKIKITETQQSLPPTRFKARSPTVLRRPAFKPILPKQPLLPPRPFVLNSELRAEERKLFDNYIKEKEHLDERLRELKKAAQKRREEEEIVKMRKETVIKAQPIRKFKCVAMPVTKRALTEPITPIVIKRQRR